MSKRGRTQQCSGAAAGEHGLVQQCRSCRRRPNRGLIGSPERGHRSRRSHNVVIVDVLDVHPRVDFVNHHDAGTLALVVLVALPVLLVIAVPVSEKGHSVHDQQVPATALGRLEAKLGRGEQRLGLKLLQNRFGEGY